MIMKSKCYITSMKIKENVVDLFLKISISLNQLQQKPWCLQNPNPIK